MKKAGAAVKITAVVLAMAAAFLIIGGIFRYYGGSNQYNQQIVQLYSDSRILNEADLLPFSRNDLKFGIRWISEGDDAENLSAVQKKNLALLKRELADYSKDNKQRKEYTKLKPAYELEYTDRDWNYLNYYRYDFNVQDPNAFYSLVPGTFKDHGLYYTVKAFAYRGVTNYEDIPAALGMTKEQTEKEHIWPVDQLDGSQIYYDNGNRINYGAGVSTLCILKGAAIGSFTDNQPVTEELLKEYEKCSGQQFNTVIFDSKGFVVGIFDVHHTF